MTIPSPINQGSENREKFVNKITPTKNIMTRVSEKITIFFDNYFNSLFDVTNEFIENMWILRRN